ncbi:TetR/AcrR family transcriptional regulator [Streptomyces sp. NPDC001858]
MHTDAARNAQKIAHAAREVFAAAGPDAPLEAVARNAGVGIATLYRHFPTKEDLLKAALRQSVAEQLQPAIELALANGNPRDGLEIFLRATLSMVARERHILTAADRSGALTAEITEPYLESLTLLTRTAQDAGLVRADVVPDDMHKLMSMLMSLFWTTPSEDEDWSRYVTLLLDSLSPLGATPLPPAGPRRPCGERAGGQTNFARFTAPEASTNEQPAPE